VRRRCCCASAARSGSTCQGDTSARVEAPWLWHRPVRASMADRHGRSARRFADGPSVDVPRASVRRCTRARSRGRQWIRVRSTGRSCRHRDSRAGEESDA